MPFATVLSSSASNSNKQVLALLLARAFLRGLFDAVDNEAVRTCITCGGGGGAGGADGVTNFSDGL